MFGLVELAKELPKVIQDAEDDYIQAQQTIEQLNDEIKKLQDNHHKKKVRAERTSSTRYKETILELHDQIKTEKEHHEQVIDAAQEEIMKLQQDNTLLNGVLAELTKEVENRSQLDLTTSPTALGKDNNEREFSEGQIREAKNEIKLIDRIVYLKQKLKQYKRTITELKQELRDNKQTYECPESEKVIHRLQGELEHTKTTYAALQAKHQNAESEISMLQDELQNALNRLKVAETTKCQKEDDFVRNVESHIDEEIESYKDAVTHLKHQLDLALHIIKREGDKHKAVLKQKEDVISDLVVMLESRRDVNKTETESTIHYQEIEKQLNDAAAEVNTLRAELDDTKTRLSQLMSQNLTDNNPNIADLSDKNRPTKLAERYSELYDNQWTDAYEVVDTGDERQTIGTLLDLLFHIMDFCKYEAAYQMKRLQLALGQNEGSISTSAMKQLKDIRKTTAEVYGRELIKKYFKGFQYSKSTLASVASVIRPYVEECLILCWLMCVQDPPVVLKPNLRPGPLMTSDGGTMTSSEGPLKPGGPFPADLFRAYTESGPRVDFIVWPALLLHNDGPVLCKGVAQGMKAKSSKGRGK